KRMNVLMKPDAVVTRERIKGSRSNRKIDSKTMFPDVILVSTGGGSNGRMNTKKTKATSHDHYWYGRLTAIDPTSLSIAVTRADGQRRLFHVTDHTNIQISGGTHAGWANLQLGGVLEVDWIPGDNDTSATVLEAHSIALTKS